MKKPALPSAKYFTDQLPRVESTAQTVWAPPASAGNEDLRVAQQLNGFYRDWLTRDETSLFIGEDIEDPYGGAFKISKGLTTAFGARVRTTPISEAAITGIGVGLAVSGRRAFVEIMFGDFITYAFDQIVNNASKMFHMYNQQIDCPVILRTPMGGRRGYGPTHSQSLERFLIGIDNCCTVSLNSLIGVPRQLAGLEHLRCPVLLIENKSDYTLRTLVPPDGFSLEVDGALLPTVRIRPAQVAPTVTLVSYGGMARFVANALIEIFERTDAVAELIVPGSISPLNLNPIADSLGRSRRLVILEEGSGFGSVGAEMIAQLSERLDFGFMVRRVSGKPTPIPSAPALEAAALPSVDEICAAVVSMMESAWPGMEQPV